MRGWSHAVVHCLCCALWMTACGGGQESGSADEGGQAAAASGGEQTVSQAGVGGPTSQPQGRLRVGHYSTIQGTDGFVLDQTGQIPLVRIDGANDIWELASTPGPLDSIELRNDEGNIWIRITRDHQVLFDGPNQHEGVECARDADATPLRQ